MMKLTPVEGKSCVYYIVEKQ